MNLQYTVENNWNVGREEIFQIFYMWYQISPIFHDGSENILFIDESDT